jgi:RNA polymerase subunit RPABC4/transcription elongation factor Spt4
MTRLGCMSIVGATVIAVIAAAIHVPAVGVTVIFFAVLGLAFVGGLVPVIKGESAFSCPHCRKMVKLGATTCHHCGRSVARPRRPRLAKPRRKAAVSRPAPRGVWRCVSCERSFDAGRRRCPYCGVDAVPPAAG